MRYKIIITCPKKHVAEEVHRVIEKSNIYNSSEIVNLSIIKEVCDECANK